MAQYTTKRKYTKKPTGTKKVVKKVTTQEVIEPAVKSAPVAKKSIWQKIVDWVKSIAG